MPKAKAKNASNRFQEITSSQSKTEKKNSEKNKDSETIMFLGAHSDDTILGGGGTMAKYVKEGKNVVSIIFSFGEKSHPWLQRKHTIEMRVNEAKEAVRVLGYTQVLFFGLAEGKFPEEIKEKGTLDKLRKLVDIHKPTKIFTHSIDDPHPDHRAVYKATMDMLNKRRYAGDVYSYNVWNPANFRKRDEPKLVVNINDTFWKKIEALKAFRSQKIALIQLIPVTFVRAIRNGIFNRCRFAEVFIKAK
ncbi:PIG-L family deacetylase [Candidatus Woesearchaeota archaeon]|nr:PIG-L family deacetylase [Candidatus Woesearchaeota archaeon]